MTAPRSATARRAALATALSHPNVRAPFRTWHVPEPAILVGQGQMAPDPKAGLAQWGPWQGKDGAALGEMKIGIIGTGDTIQLAQQWLQRCRGRIDPHPDTDPVLFPSFPGMESESGFSCRLETPSAMTETLTPLDVTRIVKAPDRDHAVEEAARILRERMEALAERDVRPSIILVALPEEVRKAAGGGRRHFRKGRNKSRPKPASSQLTLNFLDPRPVEPFGHSRTLHRVIKAEGMRVGIPTQLAWPAALEGGPRVQDEATRAWNLCTAAYYKAGGVPWRVDGLDAGTCYVGVSFFKPVGAPSYLQTSMAQAFSDRGEGTVLRGAPLEHDPQDGPPTLPREHARDLLEKVLALYEKHHRRKPSRVVVYKSSRMQASELAGFGDALGDAVPYYDFLSLGPSKVRFLRQGHEPPIRGTVIELEPRRYIVYTRGYVPYLGVYPGLRIPQPLEVRHHGTRPVTDVVRELLALSRLNWNSADFASAEPITLGFARNVGLVLSEMPGDIEPQTAFRYYM